MHSVGETSSDIYIFCVSDARNFHTAITKVKSGKGSSVFTERTDDSSAMQYFQVLHIVIISGCNYNIICISRNL
jgi:hypothetical protein